MRGVSFSVYDSEEKFSLRVFAKSGFGLTNTFSSTIIDSVSVCDTRMEDSMTERGSSASDVN